MISEGIKDERLVVAVCGCDKQSDTKATEEPMMESKIFGKLSAEEEQLVGKYRSMLKAGVPPNAVQNKMRAEGLVLKLITAVVGGTNNIESKSIVDGERSQKKAPSKLMTLHWTPLEVSEEQLEDTVWAKSQQARMSRKSKSRKCEVAKASTISNHF